MQQELLKKPSQKQRLLRLLQTKGAVSNIEFNDTVGYRYGARIFELKADGYLIDTGPTDKYGRVIYTYQGKKG